MKVVKVVKHAVIVFGLVAGANYITRFAVGYVNEVQTNLTVGKQIVEDMSRRRGEWKLKCVASGGKVFRLAESWEHVCIEGKIADTYDDDIWSLKETTEGSPWIDPTKTAEHYSPIPKETTE